MAQAAYNGILQIPKDEWIFVTEVPCTFVVEFGVVELLGTSGSAPLAIEQGITYKEGQGVEPSFDILALFPGAGTVGGVYMTSRGFNTRVFLSRPAVA